MPKTALQNGVYLCAAGAFGVFFRWMQLQMAFDDAKLAGPSAWNVIVPLSILLAAWLYRRFVGAYRSAAMRLPRSLYRALKNEHGLYRIARWGIGGIMCLGALLLLAKSETDKYMGFLRVLAALGFLTGLAFPLLLTEANRESGQRRSWLAILCSLIPILFFAWWLICCYRYNAINSVVWAYVIEALTLAVAMVAFFYAAGFAFGQARAEWAMTVNMLGSYLCFMSLADERYTGMQLMLFAAALMQVLLVWIMTNNMVQGKVEEQEQPSDGFERL